MKIKKDYIKKLTATAVLCAMLCFSSCGNGSISVRSSSENAPSTPPDSATQAPDLSDSNAYPTSSGEDTLSPSANAVEREKDPAVEITELMVKNIKTVKDKNGNYTPFLELHNRTDNPLTLSHYTVIYDGKSYSLPEKTLKAGEYLLLFAGSDLPFSLKEAGQISLMHGELLCQSFGYMNKTDHCSFDVSSGSETATPTPGYKNAAVDSPLSFSEVLVINTLYPVSGKLTGYIELYNGGNTDLPLGNIYLSNTPEDLYRSKLPDYTLKSGEYKVFTFAELEMVPSVASSTLYLTREDGVLCGCFLYPDAQKNLSFSGTNEGTVLPSPGFPNTDKGRKDYFSSNTGLIISEVISSNTKYYPIDGNYYDLVELYNAGTTAIRLSDYYLSDSSKKLRAFALPEKTLAPGEYTVLPLKGTGDGSEGCTESNFKLSSNGDNIYLTKKDGYVCDALSLPAIPVNRSFGRSEGMLVYFATPSFGQKNGKGYETLSPLPAASLESGFYSGSQTLTLKSDGGVIHYTTDGSEATASSKEYKGETLIFSKNTTLRMICCEGEKIPSREVVCNYFIDSLSLSLPVVKVSLDREEFYGKNGIYTLNDANGNKSNKEIGANFSFYLDGKEEFSVNCGIKVFGNTSRTLPKKSYQLKFRAVYGYSSLKYDIFGDGIITEFNSLVLRSGAQDYPKAMMRDELASGTVLAYCPEVMAQNYRPVNLYVNEEYLGVYYIREKIDEHFIASHYNVSAESVTILENLAWVETGKDGAEWLALYKFIKDKDMTDPENYAYVQQHLSIESTIDYYLALTWADNRDEGNVRIFRSSEGDGKWRFIFFDSDLGFGRYSQKKSAAELLFGSYKPNEPYYNAVIYKLLQNASFKDQFLKRLAELNRTAFSNEVVLQRVAALRSAIDHDMHYMVYGGGYDYWNTDPVDGMPQLIAYLTDRNKQLVKDYTALFALTDAQVKQYFG